MVYRIVIFFYKVYLKLFFGLEAIGTENIPKDGACIICSNHIDFLDPLSIAASSKRKVHFIGKKELFESKIGGLILRQLGAFPVDRSSGTDIAALKNAVSCLKEDKILGIFYQGTRVKDLEDKSSKSGVALFALKAKCPIIPTYISGDYKFFTKVKVRFGEPLYFEEHYDKRLKKELLEDITDIISLKVTELGELE